MDSDAHTRATAILHLCGEGLLPRVRPEADDTLNSYLERAFLHRYGALIPEEVQVVLTTGRYDRQWESFSASGEGRGEWGLYVQFLPNLAGVWQAGPLRRALGKVHPGLFGALMGAMRHLLSPYLSLFTGADALMAANVTRFHEGWLDSVCEFYEDEHPGKSADRLSEEGLMRWYERRGYLTPRKMERQIPKKLYDGDRELLRLLLRPRAQRVPGLSALLDFLRHLDALDASRRFHNHWEDGYSFLYPGAGCTVVTEDPPVDVVLELRSEFEANFDDGDPFQTVTLYDQPLCSAADDLALRAYLRDLRGVLRRFARLVKTLNAELPA